MQQLNPDHSSQTFVFYQYFENEAAGTARMAPAGNAPGLPISSGVAAPYAGTCSLETLQERPIAVTNAPVGIERRIARAVVARARGIAAATRVA